MPNDTSDDSATDGPDVESRATDDVDAQDDRAADIPSTTIISHGQPVTYPSAAAGATDEPPAS